MLAGAASLTPQQWRECAGGTTGRTADVYARCAELAETRRELQEL